MLGAFGVRRYLRCGSAMLMPCPSVLHCAMLSCVALPCAPTAAAGTWMI